MYGHIINAKFRVLFLATGCVSCQVVVSLHFTNNFTTFIQYQTRCQEMSAVQLSVCETTTARFNPNDSKTIVYKVTTNIDSHLI